MSGPSPHATDDVVPEAEDFHGVRYPDLKDKVVFRKLEALAGISITTLNVTSIANAYSCTDQSQELARLETPMSQCGEMGQLQLAC